MSNTFEATKKAEVEQELREIKERRRQREIENAEAEAVIDSEKHGRRDEKEIKEEIDLTFSLEEREKANIREAEILEEKLKRPGLSKKILIAALVLGGATGGYFGVKKNPDFYKTILNLKPKTEASSTEKPRTYMTPEEQARRNEEIRQQREQQEQEWQKQVREDQERRKQERREQLRQGQERLNEQVRQEQLKQDQEKQEQKKVSQKPAPEQPPMPIIEYMTPEEQQLLVKVKTLDPRIEKLKIILEDGKKIFLVRLKNEKKEHVISSEINAKFYKMILDIEKTPSTPTQPPTAKQENTTPENKPEEEEEKPAEGIDKPEETETTEAPKPKKSLTAEEMLKKLQKVQSEITGLKIETGKKGQKTIIIERTGKNGKIIYKIFPDKGVMNTYDVEGKLAKSESLPGYVAQSLGIELKP